MSLYVLTGVTPALQSVDVLGLRPKDPGLDGGHDGLGVVRVWKSCEAGQVVQGRHAGDTGGGGRQDAGGLQGVTARHGAQGVRAGGPRQAGDHHVRVADGLGYELGMVVELEV